MSCAAWSRKGQPSRRSHRGPTQAAQEPQAAEEPDKPGRTLERMTSPQLISFARGAPSSDIVDVAGLKAAAARAFDADPAGVTAYGTSVGYPPLRQWIADKHGVPVDRVLV